MSFSVDNATRRAAPSIGLGQRAVASLDAQLTRQGSPVPTARASLIASAPSTTAKGRKFTSGLVFSQTSSFSEVLGAFPPTYQSVVDAELRALDKRIRTWAVAKAAVENMERLQIELGPDAAPSAYNAIRVPSQVFSKEALAVSHDIAAAVQKREADVKALRVSLFKSDLVTRTQERDVLHEALQLRATVKQLSALCFAAFKAGQEYHMEPRVLRADMRYDEDDGEILMEDQGVAAEETMDVDYEADENWILSPAFVREHRTAQNCCPGSVSRLVALRLTAARAADEAAAKKRELKKAAERAPPGPLIGSDAVTKIVEQKVAAALKKAKRQFEPAKRKQEKEKKGKGKASSGKDGWKGIPYARSKTPPAKGGPAPSAKKQKQNKARRDREAAKRKNKNA